MPIRQLIRDRAIGASEVLDALNRELAPVLRLCRAALNRWLQLPPPVYITAGATTLDWAGKTGSSGIAGSRSYQVSLTADLTSVTFNDPVDAGDYVFLIRQTAAFAATGWPANVTWLAGAPDLTTVAAGDTVLVRFWFDGTTYFGTFDPEAVAAPTPVVATQVTVELTNDESVAAVIGAPVYADVAAGFKLALASAAATKNVVGLVGVASIAPAATDDVVVSGVLTATTAQWDAVTGQVGGLTTNTKYYLDPATAGRLTSTAPTSNGQFVVELGLALSTVAFSVNIRLDVQL